MPLDQALGRFCAQSVTAGLAVPPADNSAMDGYAVCSRDVPAVLTVSQRIPAGSVPEPLKAGTAARIFTGAEMPVGADAVVLQEAQRRRIRVFACRAAQVGQHIRRRGNDIQPEDQLIGCRDSIYDPKILACWHRWALTALRFFVPLTVAIMTTGDELRDPGAGDLAAGANFQQQPL